MPRSSKKYTLNYVQKFKSNSNLCDVVVCLVLAITPLFWYSPTRFSKKFVFPVSEMSSMKSNGFSDLYTCKEDKILESDLMLNAGTIDASGTCFKISV